MIYSRSASVSQIALLALLVQLPPPSYQDALPEISPTVSLNATSAQNQTNISPKVAEKNDSSTVNETSKEIKKFEEYKKSPFFLPPFDPEVISIPDIQHEFVKQVVANDIELFRTILREAIEKRNNYMPSMKLMLKYSGKLLGNFIRNRQAEQRLNPRVDPKSEFFSMFANIFEQVLDKSAAIKKEKGYNSRNIDTNQLYTGADTVFNHIYRIVEASPLGGYMRWDKLKLFTDEIWNPKKDISLVDEAADLTAQFRAMGYETTTFVARRIINLLNMFSKGFIPSEKEV